MYVKVFPYNTSFETMEAFNPDGYFISNGPGDPQPLKSAQEVAKNIIEKNKPLFGICLGHQVIALANGIPTFKMFNGHRGINHPVKNLVTGRGEITSQNHGFAVDMEAAKSSSDIEVTHVHLNDQTLAGLRMKSPRTVFQYNIILKLVQVQAMQATCLIFLKKTSLINNFFNPINLNINEYYY